MSTGVLLGDTALFMCAGKAVASYWTVNGDPDSVQVNRERGVAVHDDNTDLLLYKSNLTIPGTVENDNVSIQCILYDGSTIDFSTVVYLTVLGKSHIVK